MSEQGFLSGLFRGIVAEDRIFPFPELPADERERTGGLVAKVRRFFAEHVDSAAIDRSERIPETVLRGLGALGLFGLEAPEEYGGCGLTALSVARVFEEIGRLDPSIAVVVGAHHILGQRGLLAFGSPTQKDRYLPRLTSGEWIAAFALSEVSAGSDAAAIRTVAARRSDGSYVITGSKRWVTNGGLAELFTVIARTSPLEEGERPALTAFLVERGPGVTVGPNEEKLGIRGASTTEVSFENVHVPADRVLGEPGRGFAVATAILSRGRMCLAAACVGLCQAMLCQSVDHAQARRAFGRSLSEFGLVKDRIAGMLADTFALESTTYLTAGMMDLDTAGHTLEASACKVLAAETALRVTTQAFELAGGQGYMAGHPCERALRDAHVAGFLQGSGDILRSHLALHGVSHVLDLQPAGMTGRGARRTLARLLDHPGLRRAWGGNRARLTRAHPALAHGIAVFEEHTSQLASRAEEAALRHGRDFAELQAIQSRFADAAIDLFALAACLSRTSRAIARSGVDGARREIDLTAVVARGAERRLRENMGALREEDDALRKVVARRGYADGGYPFDVL